MVLVSCSLCTWHKTKLSGSYCAFYCDCVNVYTCTLYVSCFVLFLSGYAPGCFCVQQVSQLAICCALHDDINCTMVYTESQYGVPGYPLTNVPPPPPPPLDLVFINVGNTQDNY